MRRARHCFLLAALALSAAGPALARDCRGEALEPGVLRAVADGRTLELADGRAIRLYGLEPPSGAGETAPAENEARALLRRLTGHTLRLQAAAAGLDRHGRLHAYAFVSSEGLEGLLQHAILAHGLGLVAARAGDRACVAALLARERQAREARLGLWADTRNAVQQAENPAAILRRRGEFAVVEGRVLSVRESGGTIYVNFGRRWAEDFTVTVAKRNERMLAAAGLDPWRLDQRSVRVRGVIEERGGPWIEVTRAEQVEVIRN